MAKRLFDVAVAVVATVISSPAWLAIGAAIKLDSRGPVLHRARRVGGGGQEFTLLKFRTMTVGAATAGPPVTTGGDPRITRVGRVLRSTKLDELPQLINVVRGDMSLVGPRPEDPRYVALYDEAQRAILRFRPGITSPASRAYRHEEAILAAAPDAMATYRDEVLPAKLAVDLAYFPTASVRSDLRILASTLRAVVRRAPKESIAPTPDSHEES